MRARCTAAVVGLLAVAGCGGPSADLFEVRRGGAGAGARLTLLVSDGGTVRCNGAAPRSLGDDRLLEAREVERELEDEAERGVRLGPGPQSVLRYSVRLEEGTVAFSDTSPGVRPEMRALAAFTRDVARRVCGLRR